MSGSTRDPAVVANRSVLTLCTLGLAVFWVAVVAMSDGGSAGTIGLVGFAAVVAGLAVVTVYAWASPPAPAPTAIIDRGTPATLLRASGWVFLALVLVAAGLALIAVSFLLGPSLESVGPGRRGVWVYFVVAAAPFLLAAALVIAVRRDHVIIRPDGLTVRRLGRTRFVHWDAVRGVARVPGNPADMLRVEAAGDRPLVIFARHLAVTGDELGALVRRLAANPADGAVLGTDAAAPLIGELRREWAPPRPATPHRTSGLRAGLRGRRCLPAPRRSTGHRQ